MLKYRSYGFCKRICTLTLVVDYERFEAIFCYVANAEGS